MGLFDFLQSSLRDMLPGNNHKYSALPARGARGNAEAQDSIWSGKNQRLLKFTIAGMMLSILLYLVVAFGRVTNCETLGTCSESISHLWGQYSPFFPVPSKLSPLITPGCEVTFAQVLSRHGARDPTLGKSIMYGALVERIHSSVSEYGKGYEFIKDYQYTLGADQLTLFGENEMIRSGAAFHRRYQHLAKDSKPFIRSSGQERVVESALNWTQGFYAANRRDGQDGSDKDYSVQIVIIPEADGVNNTLSHGLCTAFETGEYAHRGDAAQAPWRDIFTVPITARLNKKLPGANFTAGDSIMLMDLCPFSTVADLQGRTSPFCHLFTLNEWKDYDYYQSLGKYYGFNQGNPIGPTQGVGFVNELIARLTGQPVVDHTTTNSTLDSSPDTFPLDKVLYADFSHDNDMTGVYGALGLYNTTTTPPLHKTSRESSKDSQGYSASWTVPFAARMYVEKMRCGKSDEELVRILVNDRVVPLAGCDADRHGRCKLGAFVESLGFARNGGLWDQCFKDTEGIIP